MKDFLTALQRMPVSPELAPSQVSVSASRIHPTALPVVSIQATNPGAWLEVVQRALRETSGVFVISDLQKEMDWREACILSDMLLRSYLSATQHNPFGLHPGVDLEKGEALSTSQLSFQRLEFFQPHKDRGLFNVVLGARAAFRALFIQLGRSNSLFGVNPSVYELTAGGDDTLVAVVIPGYSLQLFEPRVLSPTHWVHHTDGTERVTQVFRCRLRPDFLVAGKAIGPTIALIERTPSPSHVRFD